MKQTHHIGYVQTPSVKNLSNVKNALVENGLVPLTTPNEMLPDAIEKSVNELKSQIPETWETMDLSKKKKYITKNSITSYFAKNGVDCYCSYNSEEKIGLYHLNIITGEETQIYPLGLYWNCVFEKANGELYFGSTNSNTTGVLYVSNLVATKIYEEGYNWNTFFQTSNGNVYVSGFSGSKGILCLNNDSATLITSQTFLTSYFESNKGDIYVGSPNSNATGVYYINGTNISKISDSTRPFNSFFETSNGDIYVGGTSYDICYIKNKVATIITTTTARYTIFYEDKNENIYAAPTGTNTGYVYHLNGTTKTNIIGIYSGAAGFLENSKGDVYLYGSVLYKLNGTKSATKVTTSTMTITNSFESSKGNFYVIASSVLYRLEDISRIFITNILKNINYFIEKPKGIIVSPSKQPDGSDFLLIDEDTDQVYLVKGGE